MRLTNSILIALVLSTSAVADYQAADSYTQKDTSYGATTKKADYTPEPTQLGVKFNEYNDDTPSNDYKPATGGYDASDEKSKEYASKTQTRTGNVDPPKDSYVDTSKQSYKQEKKNKDDDKKNNKDDKDDKKKYKNDKDDKKNSKEDDKKDKDKDKKKSSKKYKKGFLNEKGECWCKCGGGSKKKKKKNITPSPEYKKSDSNPTQGYQQAYTQATNDYAKY